MEKYKTGDVTVSEDRVVRLYVVENGVCGYFHWAKDMPCMFLQRPLGSMSLHKNKHEPVECSVEDLLKAVEATYGKKIR